MKFVDKISVKNFKDLHEAAGWKILSDKEIKRSLKNSMIVVGVKENNEIMAMARIVGDFATHGLLCDVIVHPNHQNKGIGKSMVKYIMNRAQQFANKHDQFMVELLPTPGNAAFYEKCGFKHLPDKMEGCYKWFKNEKIYKN